MFVGRRAKTLLVESSPAAGLTMRRGRPRRPNPPRPDMHPFADPFPDVPETDPDYAPPTPRQQQHWSADPRRSSEYQALRKQFREACRQSRNADGTYGLPCSICHRPINYALTHPHPMAFTVNHDLSVRSRPDLCRRGTSGPLTGAAT